MKRIYFLLFTVILFTSCNSSDEKNKDLELLMKAHLYFGNNKTIDTLDLEKPIKSGIIKNNLEKSLYYFEEILTKYPNSKLKYKALVGAALVSKKLNYYEKIIEYNKKITEQVTNENETDKNAAYVNISETYLKKREFDNAIKYLDLAKNHPSILDKKTENIYYAKLYAKAYFEKNDIEKALNYSLPYVFINDFFKKSELTTIAINSIKHKYSKENIENEIEKAIKTIRKEKDKGIFITLFNREIILSNFEYFKINKKGEIDKMSEFEKGKKLFFLSYFYKELVK